MPKSFSYTWPAAYLSCQEVDQFLSFHFIIHTLFHKQVIDQNVIESIVLSLLIIVLYCMHQICPVTFPFRLISNWPKKSMELGLMQILIQSVEDFCLVLWSESFFSKGSSDPISAMLVFFSTQFVTFIGSGMKKNGVKTDSCCSHKTNQYCMKILSIIFSVIEFNLVHKEN